MRIAVVGDICLETDLDTWRDARIPDLHDAFGADVVVGNFESVVDGSFVGTPVAGKVHLSAPGGALAKLKRVGIDYVSVANNHIMDYGADAARETVAKLESVFGEDRVFGWTGRPGAELAAGLEVLGLCFTETNPRTAGGAVDPIVVDTVDEAPAVRAHPDSALLVCAHWGEEQLSLASAEQRRRARGLVAGGASHVVGSHSHVMGSGEPLSDTPVTEGGSTALYGLGNFLFRVMPKGNFRSLASNTRSAAALYDWDGATLRYAGWCECRFDRLLHLEVRPGRGVFPGSYLSRAQLSLSESTAERVYEWALSTRGLRLGAAKVLTGVERPSVRKLRTGLGLMRASRRSGTTSDSRGPDS